MNPLHKLLLMNRGKGSPLSVKAEADETTLYLYDAIVTDEITAEWLGGVAADTFVKTVAGIKSGTIKLRINSPGGDVFAGRAMAQALKETDAKVIAYVDGFAASAASYVALAADEVRIADGGMFMIHQAWSIAFGNSEDMLSMADLLEKIDDSLVATYEKETGQSAEQLREWMKAETWFTAQESIDYGFADGMAEAKVTNMNSWDLSAYQNGQKPQIQSHDDPGIAQAAHYIQSLRNRAELVLAEQIPA